MQSKLWASDKHSTVSCDYHARYVLTRPQWYHNGYYKRQEYDLALDKASPKVGARFVQIDTTHQTMWTDRTGWTDQSSRNYRLRNSGQGD